MGLWMKNEAPTTTEGNGELYVLETRYHLLATLRALAASAGGFLSLERSL
jgi:hypothetical protein